jgi:DNA-directed RNA polymerase-3 subunit RPC5
MAASAAVLEIEDEDPVIAEYDVFTTPDLAEQTYLLQYLNRAKEQPYNESHGMQPLELRVKQNSGFIEVDVPTNVHYNYNRLNGVRWGESLRKAKEEGQNAFGVTAGFERPHPRSNLARGGAARGGASRGAPRARASETADDGPDEELEEFLNRFDDANDKGHVLNKQTLGGQILKQEDGEPKYMVGAFRGSMGWPALVRLGRHH